MNAELQGYAESLAGVHKEARKVLEGLPAQALNWTPLPQGTNSLAVLTAHMCGSEGVWIRQALTGQEVKRDREAEFRTRASSADELLALLEKAEADARSVLEATKPAALKEVVELMGGRFRLPKRGCILHAIEHLTQHLGHMQLTRQLWESRRGG